MTRTLMAVAAVGGLMLSTALAQTSAPPANSPSNMSGSSTSSSASSSSTQPITAQQPGQFLASKFRGTDVIGADNNKIGDVDDILFDKDGKVDAFVVGVGGFLGIGQKDVALPPSAFQVVPPNSPGNNTNSDMLRLSMSKDQLQQMAEFKPAQPASTVGAGAPAGSRPAPGGSPMAPSSPSR